MPITETISDINKLIIDTALMHRDETPETVLARAITEHFPGEPVAAVLEQGELNAIRAARERRERQEADKLVATYPDTQGHLFNDPAPVAWVPAGLVRRRASLAECLEWARGLVKRKQAEVEAHRQMLELARKRLQEAENHVREHETAVLWCRQHGLDPSTVSYAEVRETAAG